MTDQSKAALIMLDRHLGNFLVASPVLSFLAQQYPGSRSIINVTHWELASRIPGFPEPCILFEEKEGFWRRGKAFTSALRTLRQLKPEWVADFGGSNTGALLGGLSGAPVRICRKDKPRAMFYNRYADRTGTSRHRIDTYGAVAQAAGFPEGWGGPVVKATEADYEQLEAIGLLPGLQIVCMHVAGGKGYKHWPLKRYAAVSDWLCEQGLRPALIGAAPDRQSADAVKQFCRHQPIDLVEGLTLGALIALMAQCRLFIGNDSGPMHLAAAAGAHVVAMFGPTDPARWHPLTDNATLIRGITPISSEEGKKNFPDGRRMDSITLESVLDRLRSVLYD